MYDKDEEFMGRDEQGILKSPSKTPEETGESESVRKETQGSHEPLRR